MSGVVASIHWGERMVQLEARTKAINEPYSTFLLSGTSALQFNKFLTSSTALMQ